MKNLTTLVIDPHDTSRHKIRTVIEQLGHSVIETASAKEAIEKYRENSPDMVILEAKIRNPSGIELCQIIRQYFQHEHVIVVFISDITDEQTIIQCLRAGCDDYIRKPFSATEFSVRMERYIDKIFCSMYQPYLGRDKLTGVTVEGYRDKYKITTKLAQGGMGIIFNGYRVSDRARVAIKTLKSGTHKSDIQRFLHEVETAQNIRHPNVVRCIDVIHTDICVGYVMEHIDGQPIREKLSQKTALEIVKQVTSGLSYLHSLHLVHRDVKPQNILLTGDRAILVDLGLVKNYHQARITTVGIILGTLEFLSPEQITEDIIDIRSDIYSLGLTWYFMLTKNLPFSSQSTDHILVERLQKKPVPICTYDINILPEVWWVIKKMLARLPNERYQTPYELLQDLETVSKYFES